jgi:L-serine dehydratase
MRAAPAGSGSVMDACIERGCRTEGVMPGGLKVKRRAAQLYRQLKSHSDSLGDATLNTMDWVTSTPSP